MKHITYALCLNLIAPLAQAECNAPPYEASLPDTALAQVTERANATPFGEGLIFEATKDEDRIVLIGTFHLPDPRHTDILDLVRDDILASEALYVEAPKSEQDKLMDTLGRQPELILMQQGEETLPQLLSEQDWQAVSDASNARGIPPILVAKQRPWYFMLTLAFPPCALASIHQGEPGLDALIETLATENNIPTLALENAHDTFKILSQGTLEEQLDNLRLMVAQEDQFASLFTSMTNRYFDGQTAWVWELGRESGYHVDGFSRQEVDKSFAKMEHSLITQRNANWLPILENAMIEHDNITAAFGAAHLIGETGIPYLLQQNGWQITRRH